MSDIRKTTLKTKFRAIKLGIVLGLGLCLGPFLIGSVFAETFTESFETYNLGNINYQGDWFPLNKNPIYYEYGFTISRDHPSYGVQGIKSHPTSTDLLGSSEWWPPFNVTGIGIFSFDFVVWKKPNWAEVDFCYGGQWCVEIKIGDHTQSTIIKWQDIILAENYTINDLHRISFEYNLPENWGRISLDFGAWSATSTLDRTPPYETPYFNRFIFRSGGEFWETIYFDNFTNIGECNSTCIYCDFWECQNYEGACLWNENENQCQREFLGIPELELPPLETCEGLSTTERILCEIKNFFYRLFVPSGEKIQELRGTLDLIKEKFPYNYIVVTQDFFSYLRQNINEDQPVNFKVLNEAGTLDFTFWNTTTTLAGVSQTFLGIFKKFSIFLILLVFMVWAFSFLKRIFK